MYVFKTDDNTDWCLRMTKAPNWNERDFMYVFKTDDNADRCLAMTKVPMCTIYNNPQYKI